MINKALKNKKGYSLIEMTVAISMFAVIFLMITGIYMSLIESQRSIISTQNIQESMKYVFEVMSKEIRTAVKSDNECLPPNPERKIFNLDVANSSNGSELYFKNRNGECVAYLLQNDAGVGRLEISRAGESFYVTPNDINLENLVFNVWDDAIGTFHSRQPSVSFRVDVEQAGGKDLHKQRTTLQTTITSRYYE